jgi:predicted CXXCH cytochrome family protein
MSRRSLIVALVALLIVIGTVVLLWPSIERLVSPGVLSRVHAQLETKCSACHLAFTPLAERPKCMACHEGVARDVREKTGFHGRTDTVRRAQCRSCHTEHRGREHSLVDLRQAKFDHQKSDFPIGGVRFQRYGEARASGFRDVAPAGRGNGAGAGRVGNSGVAA